MQELDFHDANFFFIIDFQREKANNLILLIILIVKSLQIAPIYYYDPPSAGIKVQSSTVADLIRERSLD